MKTESRNIGATYSPKGGSVVHYTVWCGADSSSHYCGIKYWELELSGLLQALDHTIDRIKIHRNYKERYITILIISQASILALVDLRIARDYLDKLINWQMFTVCLILRRVGIQSNMQSGKLATNGFFRLLIGSEHCCKA